MPCNDGYGPGHTVEYVEKEHDGKMAARLCAVFTELERRGALDGVLRYANWNEAGVTELNTRNWWTEHKRRDALRKQREANEARQKRLKASAIRKLNEEERKALGL